MDTSQEVRIRRNEDRMSKPINFSPFAQNVLDYVGRENLRTASGKVVAIYQTGSGFDIFIDGTSVAQDVDNLQASYILNTNEVGIQ